MPKKMFEEGEPTPAQQEHKKEGLPVPIWFIAFLAIATLAAVFGPSLMAGIGESSIVDTPNFGGSELSQPPAGDADTEVDVVPEETDIETDRIGKIGTYYPIISLPQEISSEKRPDINLVDIRIENDILKFSIVKNDDERFNNVRYNDVSYNVKVIAYRGEPHNREITYSFLSDRLNIKRGQKENIVGDLSLLELQSADSSSGKLQKTSCEIRQIMFYFK